MSQYGLPEQQAFTFTQQGKTCLPAGKIQRRTITPPGQGNYVQYGSANPHYAGHYAGLHPEDQPFLTDDLDDKHTQVPARLTPRSAVRWQGAAKPQAHPKKRIHWLVWIG